MRQTSIMATSWTSRSSQWRLPMSEIDRDSDVNVAIDIGPASSAIA